MANTYEDILARCLTRVTDEIDKSQGSIIYDALAPACAELAQMYIELENQLNLTFADTSSGDYLTKRCAEFGVNRQDATYAIRKGVFTGAQPQVGDRFGLNELTYIVTDISGGLSNTQLQCEQVGVIGNRDTGTLLPIDNIAGLETATLSDILINGEDEESDADLYARFNDVVNSPIYAGNANHYKIWANEVDGVGGANVVPVWNGANTVKVVIIDSDKTGASGTLVTNVQDYIDPNQNGDGEGQAPIGAIVTVVSASEVSIDVVATLTLAPGADLPTVTDLFEIALIAYLRDIAFSADTTVRISQVGNILLDVNGVTDYTGLTLNLGTSNITIAKRQMGNGSKYREIATLNNIKNPNLIFPGQLLKIPEV